MCTCACTDVDSPVAPSSSSAVHAAAAPSYPHYTSHGHHYPSHAPSFRSDLTADVPAWAPATTWHEPGYSTHAYGHGHSHAYVQSRTPSPPLYVRESSPPLHATSRVFVTQSGQEIEFLDTAKNVPWRH